ncbi:hypothetical protein ABK040_007736 [Willaertia magna]
MDQEQSLNYDFVFGGGSEVNQSNDHHDVDSNGSFRNTTKRESIDIPNILNIIDVNDLRQVKLAKTATIHNNQWCVPFDLSLKFLLENNRLLQLLNDKPQEECNSLKEELNKRQEELKAKVNEIKQMEIELALKEQEINKLHQDFVNEKSECLRLTLELKEMDEIKSKNEYYGKILNENSILIKNYEKDFVTLKKRNEELLEANKVLSDMVNDQVQVVVDDSDNEKAVSGDKRKKYNNRKIVRNSKKNK